MVAYKTLEERPGECQLKALDEGKEAQAYTLPPRSFELMVKTTEPTVTREMTSEKTCIDCSGGDYTVSVTTLESALSDTYVNREHNR